MPDTRFVFLEIHMCSFSEIARRVLAFITFLLPLWHVGMCTSNVKGESRFHEYQMSS